MNGTEGSGKRSKLGPAVAFVSTAALACGVCCVLPFALPAAALALGGGVLAWFASAYRLMTYLSVAAAAGGWTWVTTQSVRTKKRPARTTLTSMIGATVMLLLALLWQNAEGMIVSMLIHCRPLNWFVSRQ